MKLHIARLSPLWLISGLTILGALFLFSLKAGDTVARVTEAVITSNSETTELPQNTFSYPVVGTVRAADAVVVRARQAGVVSEIFVTEGDAAGRGTTLSVILDPVLSARLSEQETASLIMQLREESAALARVAGATEAAINLATASSTSKVSLAASRHGLETAVSSAELALATVRTTIPAVLRFVQDNKSYFTSDSMEAYRSSLATFYGTQPSYLRVGPLTNVSTDTALWTELNNASTTEEVALVLKEVKQALLDFRVVFADSAAEFLDRTELDSSDPVYLGYLETQQDILALEAALVSAESDLALATDGESLTSTTEVSRVATSEVASVTATEQALLAEALLKESSALAAAQNSVVRAGLSLGVEAAPFSGTVQTVYVEDGENVQPGTPLLSLIGGDAREVVVSVPVALLSRVAVGQPVTLDGRFVGVVDRVAPPREFGSGEVFIILSEDFAVGTTLWATLELPIHVAAGERTVSRAYLGFAPAGPYVVTREGAHIPVAVVHDAGESLVVSGAISKDTILIPLVGIRL